MKNALLKEDSQFIRFRKKVVHILRYEKLRTLNLILLVFFGLALLYPLYYAIFGSISTKEEFAMATLIPIPHNAWNEFVTNYTLLFRASDSSILRSMGVTFLRMAWSFFISTVTAVLGGFAFAKLHFPFKKPLFLFMLGTMMIPGVALMIPNYIWLTKFPLVGGNNILGEGGSGFVNNPLYLFATGWVGVYNIFLFRQAFVGIGGELMESAKIDGANLLRVIFTIYTPLVAPLIFVILLNSVTGIWSDYMTDIIYLPDNAAWWSLGRSTIWWADYYTNVNLSGGADYPKAFAVLVFMMIPPVILFIAVQRKFVAGLTAGAVKG